MQVDKVLPEEEVIAFHRFVKGLSFKRKEYDSNEDEYPIFSLDFNCDEFVNKTSIGKQAISLLKEFSPDWEQYKLIRCYINMCHYGDMEYPHFDCARDEDDITVLYYVNDQWDYRWGGETLFYEDGETKLAFLPAPGRFLLFWGAIEHKGCVPSRICKVSRFTLAMKYSRKSE
jgi:Rps23 Pro-64 3,4-dihydroxylase Tpa1-like proline 4-hydroxylase